MTEPLLPTPRADADPAQLAGVPGLLVRTVVDLQVREAPGDDPFRSGTFDGYGCVWGVRDAYGTEFAKGCFIEGGLDQGVYALLWMHQPWEVLGGFYATEDDHGLKVTGWWDATPAGQEARTRAHTGSAPGLSVGFVPIGVDPDDENVFTSCRLVETSQITARMAAVPGASLVGVRGTGDLGPGGQAALAQARRDQLRRLAQRRLRGVPQVRRWQPDR